MWAIARLDFGIEEREIGRLTLGEFDELRKRQVEREHKAQILAGIIASTVWNARPFQKEGTKPASVLDFCPDLREKQTGGQTEEEMIDEIVKALGCGPGVN